MNIGIAASSDKSGRDDKIAREFCSMIKGNNIILGGYWGLMRSVAVECSRENTVVFILPNNPPPFDLNSKNFVVINTGMDFKARSVILVKSSDVLVSLGGESGTMIEILMAYSYGIPVVLLTGNDYSTDKLVNIIPFDVRKSGEVIVTNSAREAALIALSKGKSVKIERG
jgi:uncharacterized protein (TIGR00725 family)